MTPLKNEITALLKEKRTLELAGLPYGKKKILNALISLSYDKKNPVSWRAIEAIGLITKETAKSDPETVRHTAERLLWMIRDESGGIGWSAPEILGEIVRNNPELCADIAPVIVSFHDEPPLRAGVLRAAGRMGKNNSEMTACAIPVALSYLKDPDPSVRGHAAWALGEIHAIGAVQSLEKLKHDSSVFTIYEDGELKDKTIGEISSEAVKKLG